MSMISTTYDGWVTFKRRIQAIGQILTGILAILSAIVLAFLLTPYLWDAAAGIGIATAIVIAWGANRIILAFPKMLSPFTNAPGTARMGTRADLQQAGLIGARNRNRDIYCGKFKGERVYYAGDRHGITAGPTRSGKDMRYLVENIRNLKRSLVIMDPKGELAAITALYRQRMGSTVIVINPFGILTENRPHLLSVGFNPLMGFSPNDPEFFSKSMAIAEALVQIEGTDPHWTRRGRALVAALVMGVKWLEKEGKLPDGTRYATMGMINEMLASPYKAQGELSLLAILKKIAAHPDPQAANTARSFLNEEGSKEIDGSISAAQGQMAFLNDGTLVRDMNRHPMIKGKPFDFKILKHQNITVYLILPVTKLVTHAVWLRLLVSNAINSLSDVPGPIRPVLILNEAGNLGHMQPLENGMGIAAGMGITFWTLWQSLEQIIKIYGRNGFGNFMSGAGFVHAFAPKDPETAKYLSERMGNRTAEMASYSKIGEVAGIKSVSVASYPLMYPDQIMGLPEGKAIVFADPLFRPLMLDVPGYWEISAHGLEPNPYYVKR